MKIRISIDMSNAAFADYGNRAEVKRILFRLIEDLGDCAKLSEQKLFDANGNACGKAEIIA